MVLDIDNTLILIVDIQEKLLNAVFNKEIVEKKSEIVAKASSILEIPVVVSEQYPKGLGETVSEIKNNLVNASFFEKTTFNALEVSELCNEIKNSGKKQVVVVGIETHICVHQTVDALIKSGFDVVVLKDVCGSREEVEYVSALEHMKDAGAKIKTTEMFLFELLKSAKHPKFKDIQSLIK